MPEDVELRAVQYPGHGDRLEEPVATDLRRLAADIAEVSLPLLDRPFALYGHSMGALVAFHTALHLQALGRPPVAVTVSGMPAPRLVRPGAVHRGDDAAMLAELRRLGGVPEEILAWPDLLAMALRVARADYRLVETYRAGPAELLSAPVTVHRGTADPELTAAEAAGWASATSGRLALRTFAGDHFHPLTDPEPVVAEVLAGLLPRPERPAAHHPGAVSHASAR
jgi:pyochelin biosynthetic protein PchC